MHIEYYRGSLDFSCDCCERNSYDNYHFMEKGELLTVACLDCIKKAVTEVPNK